jgi:hypothetical protein
MTILGYIAGILLVIGTGLFAAAAFIVANIENIEESMHNDD